MRVETARTLGTERGELCRLFRSRVALAEEFRLLQAEYERVLERRS